MDDKVCGVVRRDEVFSIVFSTLTSLEMTKEEVLDYRCPNGLCLTGCLEAQII